MTAFGDGCHAPAGESRHVCKNRARPLHKRHGQFTYYTLLGLKGKADADNDGWVTTTELYNYVKENVSDATNEVQVPVLKGAREIRLGRVR